MKIGDEWFTYQTMRWRVVAISMGLGALLFNWLDVLLLNLHDKGEGGGGVMRTHGNEGFIK
jgi:hypothetical protein